jgi:hypothetical protein
MSMSAPTKQLYDYRIKCHEDDLEEPVLVFETQDSTQLCMITQEPIHESYVEFCREAILRYPFEKCNGIRLACSHEFNASCLIWFWMINRMVCPCCRYGIVGTASELSRASVTNFKEGYRHPFEDRQLKIQQQEAIQLMEDAENSVIDDWVDFTVVGSIHIEFSPQVVLYMYGTNGTVYTTVLPLHRSAVHTSQPTGIAFNVQRNDLRMISRSLQQLQINSVRVVLFLYDGYNTNVIIQSPHVRSVSLAANHEPSTGSTRTIPGFSIVDNPEQVQQLVPDMMETTMPASIPTSIPASIPITSPTQIEHEAHMLGIETPEAHVFYINRILERQQYRVVSRNEANGIIFSEIEILSDRQMGMISMTMEEPTTRGILHRISEIRWIGSNEDYGRAMQLMEI